MSAGRQHDSESLRQLQQLSLGVKDRGVTLPSGWRCEVIPRKCDLPVRGQDVVFQSPGGATFRSTVDVYHHLGLAAHLPKGHKKRKDRSDDLQEPADESRLKLIAETPIEELPQNLQQVPIMCNNTQGIWYLSDNMVECTETHCTKCTGQSLAQRYMCRSGSNGFGRHSGLSESVWRTAFKVDLPGYEGMTVDAYFKHCGYSLQYVRKSANKPSRRRQSPAPPSTPAVIQAGSGASLQPPAFTEAAGRKVQQGLSSQQEKQLTDMQEQLASQSNMISQLQDQLRQHRAQLKDRDSQITDLTASLKAGDADKGSGPVHNAQHKQVDAMQAAHAKDIATFRAQGAQAKAEYMQVLGEKQKLQDTIYDLKVRQAAHQT